MNYDTHHLHHLQIICPTHNFFLYIIFHKRHISHTLFVLYIILLYTICLIHHFKNTLCVLRVLCQIHHFTYLSFVLQIIFPAQHLSWTKNSLDRFLLNPIPAGGRGGSIYCIKCLFFDDEMCTLQKVGGEDIKGRRVLGMPETSLTHVI